MISPFLWRGNLRTSRSQRSRQIHTYEVGSWWSSGPSLDVAIQRKAKISTMPDWPALSVYYYADDRFEMGVETVREGKNQFKIYDVEKTVADIVFFREKVGIEETKEILVNYLRRKDRNLNRLMRYAELLKCGEVMKTYLEVLV